MFNFKKDINQIKETGKKIKEKFPLFTSIIKSFFAVIKWTIVLFIILFIICLVIQLTISYMEKQEKEQESKAEREFCEEKCINSEKERCYEDCLGLPSLKGMGL